MPTGASSRSSTRCCPWGQQRFGAERLRILSQCRADRISASNGHVDGVECRLEGAGKLRVRADRVVVSAGTVSSSWLLMQSRLGGGRVGEGFACNMGSPITAEFDDELHSYDGLQISHLLQPGGDAGFVMETWFNPVLAQALAMPGWFEDHRRNMRRYAHMAATGVLVGTESNGRIKRALTGGPDVVFSPTERDLDHLIEGLKLAGRIYLRGRRPARDAGDVRVSRLRARVRARPPRRARHRPLGHPDRHRPSAGRKPALDRRPRRGSWTRRSFRVHGIDNLYVCDASVFPTSTTVNPQMTVMSLAEHAAPLIAAGA